MSATDWLQKARARLYATPFLPAALPAGDKSVFNVAELQSFVWLPQTNINELPQKPITVPLPILDGVEKIAFGLYLSPNYIQPDGPMPGTIAVTPTGGAIQAPVPIPGLRPVTSARLRPDLVPRLPAAREQHD